MLFSFDPSLHLLITRMMVIMLQVNIFSCSLQPSPRVYFYCFQRNLESRKKLEKSNENWFKWREANVFTILSVVLEVVENVRERADFMTLNDSFEIFFVDVHFKNGNVRVFCFDFIEVACKIFAGTAPAGIKVNNDVIILGEKFVELAFAFDLNVGHIFVRYYDFYFSPSSSSSSFLF